MKKNRYILFIILFMIIVVFGTISFYYGLYLIKTDTIEMDLVVGNKVGFNTATDALHFGTVYNGADSNRNLLVINKNNFPVIVSIKNTGELSKWIHIDKNNFILAKFSNSSIAYTASPPLDAEQRKYLGESKIFIKRKFI